MAISRVTASLQAPSLSRTSKLTMWWPGVSVLVWNVDWFERSPSREENQRYSTISPSPSLPLPLKVTFQPGIAVAGAIETMVAVGGGLSRVGS